MKNYYIIGSLKNIFHFAYHSRHRQCLFISAILHCFFLFRTHKFHITKRSNIESLTTNAPIHNLNVIGKRGNIVQVYPAVEYGFEPAVLKVNKGDYVMPQ